ncbi:MAG TPA: uroporphyrinogen-III C-methyltransferase [Burkholderiaceae bacterium]|nr:uroporphyrinogen-III C-methyltransferase [Burkholderiaceae bacterium]
MESPSPLPPPDAPAPALPAPPLQRRLPQWASPAFGVLAMVAAFAVYVAWQTQQRVIQLEQEQARRYQVIAEQAAEARVLAKQAQDVSRESAAKSALLEVRVAEVALQRGQLEELIQSLSRSRDENLVTDIEAAIRVALQQTAITGSAEPLVASLRSAEERLARVNQPRLEGVRRALARDLDRVRSVGVADFASLLIKIDEVVRLVDDLPLLSTAAAAVPASASVSAPASASAVRPPVRVRAAASAPAVKEPTAEAPAGPWTNWLAAARQPLQDLWAGLRALLRVTRIDRPEAVLIAPEQSFFLRENLKLRLLNVRLALLSRQYDTAQVDLQVAQAALARYFDTSSRRTAVAQELLNQAVTQGRMSAVPRPDETLAALTAAAAGK